MIGDVRGAGRTRSVSARTASLPSFLSQSLGARRAPPPPTPVRRVPKELAELLEQDLDENWEVIAEAIQTILRCEGYPNPYEELKELTRTNEKINQKIFHDFIDKLKINDKLKERLKKITPYNYTGI